MRSYDEPILASGAGVCRLRWPEGAVERDARHSAGAGHGSDWPERRRQDHACQRADRLSAADQRPRDARWCRDQRDERPSGSTARGRPDFPVRAIVSRSLGSRQSCGDRGWAGAWPARSGNEGRRDAGMDRHRRTRRARRRRIALHRRAPGRDRSRLDAKAGLSAAR